MIEAVIMAGGKGTRIRSAAEDIPKPMIPVAGKPVLEHQIDTLRKNGIKNMTLVVGYKKEKIIDYFGDGSNFGVEIDYIEETEPLGTGGALFYLKNRKNSFLLLFGDVIFDIDIEKFILFHYAKKSKITLFVHPNSHPFDSDIVETDDTGRVIAIRRKNEERNFYYHNQVNAGIYCINPDVLKSLSFAKKCDLDKEIVVPEIENNGVYAYKSPEYVKDMGTPDRLSRVEQDILNNIPECRSLNSKQKAVFLDRDGTINKYKGILANIDDFELEDSAAAGIKKLNEAGYIVVVITNQPVIARGELSFAGLNEIHKKMETLLGKEGAYVDGIYFCPHHPDCGYEGEIPELKKKCLCRKPEIGMIKEAAEQYNIDLSKSWFIGDTTIDIQTGKNAGIKTILLKTGAAGKDGKYSAIPDYITENLPEAAKIVCK